MYSSGYLSVKLTNLIASLIFSQKNVFGGGEGSKHKLIYFIALRSYTLSYGRPTGRNKDEATGAISPGAKILGAERHIKGRQKVLDGALILSKF